MTNADQYRLCMCGQPGIYGTSSCTAAGCCSEPASDRELRFKQAVLDVINEGEHPSGVRIRRKLGKLRFPTDGNLGSPETRWRRELLTALGWTRPSKDGVRGKWKPPEVR